MVQTQLAAIRTEHTSVRAKRAYIHKTRMDKIAMVFALNSLVLRKQIKSWSPSTPNKTYTNKKKMVQNLTCETDESLFWKISIEITKS